MTTRLAGKDTFFLPFNKGRGGGKGNPDNPARVGRPRTSGKRSGSGIRWLDILARFVHLDVKEKIKDGKKVRKETIIFPRYHQLDAVRKLLAAARTDGPGQQLPDPALGRQRQEQHHRMAGPPAREPARRATTS